MGARDEGGPAFPTPYQERDGDNWSTSFQNGMTLRDYFAAAALQGSIAASCNNSRDPYPDNAAKYAYQVADAMLEARKK